MTDLNALSKSDPPSTVAEAVDRLLDILDEDDKQDIAGMSPDELIDLHFGLGMGVRNAWLWQESMPLKMDCGKFHPDDASAVIRCRPWRTNVKADSPW